MSDHAIGVGVIGMGWMGTVHARAYRAVADRFHDTRCRARLVICSDNVAARAEEAQDRFGFEQVSTDWREVIAHPEVEIVNIATPNFLHRELALAAIGAHKHLFVEKPVGRDPDETLAIHAAARAEGLLGFVGLNYRWAPMIQFARELIERGELGRITHFRGRFFAMYASDPLSQLTWRFLKEKSGSGILGDVMAHVVDMAHFLVGPIREVSSQKHTFITDRPLPVPGRGTHFSLGQPDDPTGAVTNEDYVGALVTFENGARGTLEVCRVISGPKCEFAIEINGTRGALSWNFERMNELQLYLPDGTRGHEGFARIVAGPEHPFHGRFNPGPGLGIGYDDLKTIEAYHVLDAVARGEQGAPGLAEAAAFAHVHAAMMRSWKSGARESVPST